MVDRIINVFTISPKKTHAAVIMIDDIPTHALRFNTFQGKNLTNENVRRVVDTLEFAKGKTRIDLALRMAYKEMFSKKEGGRTNARKVRALQKSYNTVKYLLIKTLTNKPILKHRSYPRCPSV